MRVPAYSGIAEELKFTTRTKLAEPTYLPTYLPTPTSANMPTEVTPETRQPQMSPQSQSEALSNPRKRDADTANEVLIENSDLKPTPALTPQNAGGEGLVDIPLRGASPKKKQKMSPGTKEAKERERQAKEKEKEAREKQKAEEKAKREEEKRKREEERRKREELKEEKRREKERERLAKEEEKKRKEKVSVERCVAPNIYGCR
ncbi:hypothetical protein KEM55_005156 [Ascosphaera atra]|nr:hypothetical protein KEM55_005156 [Ascosphaera atra]